MSAYDQDSRELEAAYLEAVEARERDSFVVFCPDGRKRHDQPFPNRAAAHEFAEWGHACRPPHFVEPTATAQRTPYTRALRAFLDRHAVRVHRVSNELVNITVGGDRHYVLFLRGGGLERAYREFDDGRIAGEVTSLKRLAERIEAS